MPHIGRWIPFGGVAGFCFLMALLQFFLANQVRAAGAFALFGLAALVVGFVFPDEDEEQGEDAAASKRDAD